MDNPVFYNENTDMLLGLGLGLGLELGLNPNPDPHPNPNPNPMLTSDAKSSCDALLAALD